MTLPIISRPEFVIVHSPNGKRISWNCTAKSWRDEYQPIVPGTQHAMTFETEAKALASTRKFAKHFDSEASDIENGLAPVSMIMDILMDHGYFKSRRKLSKRAKELDLS